MLTRDPDSFMKAGAAISYWDRLLTLLKYGANGGGSLGVEGQHLGQGLRETLLKGRRKMFTVARPRPGRRLALQPQCIKDLRYPLRAYNDSPPPSVF